MVTRRTAAGEIIGAEEKIPLIEAFRMYTVYAAYASGEEKIKGGWSPGNSRIWSFWSGIRGTALQRKSALLESTKRSWAGVRCTALGTTGHIPVQKMQRKRERSKKACVGTT